MLRKGGQGRPEGKGQGLGSDEDWKVGAWRKEEKQQPPPIIRNPAALASTLHSTSSVLCLLFFIQSESPNGKGSLPVTSALPALLEK